MKYEEDKQNNGGERHIDKNKRRIDEEEKVKMCGDVEKGE